ncbi:MAG: heat-inducible transcriptional repressor [Actinomycetota bacterium]|jgi:heat-inducible transcriptional repressor|nr:heat-inducible transcriptional repressor [Actinomycetota bacterium]
MTAAEKSLDERKALVLRAIVSHYVSTGEPVGSKTLVDRYKLRVSPATVRNDMGALEEWGYIYQPHTSAGRIPTDTGYRFFVDAWGSDVRLPAQQAQEIRSFFGQPRWELEDSLRQTAALLSHLTDHAAVVFAPVLDRSMIRHVELVRLATNRAMVVLVTDNGLVENHPLSLSEVLEDVGLEETSSMLNQVLIDQPLDTAGATIRTNLERFPSELRNAVASISAALDEDVSQRENDRVFLEGASNIVDEQKFADLETVRQVIGALENRRLLLEVMADALSVENVSVRIGSENQAAGMQASSVISAPYGVGGNILGSLGVVGPTRMDYRKTIAAVYEVSANLGRMLTELGM